MPVCIMQSCSSPAEVKCVSGCECDSSVLDAIWEFQHSQLGGHNFAATQHKECSVNITIMEESSSDGHKVPFFTDLAFIRTL